MAIVFELEEYCHNCPQFEVRQEGPEVTYSDGEVYHVSDVIISCQHRDICKKFTNYLKRRMQNEKS